MPERDAPSSGTRRGRVLESVGRRCLDEIGVDHVAVSIVEGRGSWTPAYASDGPAAELQQQSLTLGEGPVPDVLRFHSPVLVPDLASGDTDARWPVWASRAVEAGVRSVAGFPVQAGAITAGVLVLLSDSAGPLQQEQLVSAFRLADVAFVGLLDLMSELMNPGTAADPGHGPPTQVLRVEVHQAVGMIMVQAGVPVDEALVRLRARSFRSGRSLVDVATDVVARRARFDNEY